MYTNLLFLCLKAVTLWCNKNGASSGYSSYVRASTATNAATVQLDDMHLATVGTGGVVVVVAVYMFQKESILGTHKKRNKLSLLILVRHNTFTMMVNDACSSIWLLNFNIVNATPINLKGNVLSAQLIRLYLSWKKSLQTSKWKRFLTKSKGCRDVCLVMKKSSTGPQCTQTRG